MKIRILQVTNQFPLVGMELTIDDATAEDLIATGIAERADPGPDSATESAVEEVTPPPIETAEASDPTARQRPAE